MDTLDLKLKHAIDQRLGRCITVEEHDMIVEYIESPDCAFDMHGVPNIDDIIEECVL